MNKTQQPKTKEIAAEDLMEKANMEEYDYEAGELESILKKCPKGKVIYTAIDGDDGEQWLEVGLRFINRYAVYFGDDLGYPNETLFKFTNFSD